MEARLCLSHPIVMKDALMKLGWLVKRGCQLAHIESETLNTMNLEIHQTLPKHIECLYKT